MTKVVKLRQLTDPDAAAYVTDAFGDPMAAIYLHELRDWVWVIELVERWLQHTAEATRVDYAAFMNQRFGPCDHASLGDVSWMLSTVVLRLQVLLKGAPS